MNGESELKQETEIEQLVAELHRRPEMLVCVVAGAGTKALHDMLGVAGASRTLLEGLIPYSKGSFNRFLGKTPEKYVSKKVSQQLAGRALTRAQLLAKDDSPLIGVACTATIVTDRIKRGAHRAYIAVWKNEYLKSYYLILDKGKRNREQEEAVVSAVLLNIIAEAMAVEKRIEIDFMPGDSLEHSEIDFKKAIARVYQKKKPFFEIRDFGRTYYTKEATQAVLCGSFNPLHEGHLRLAAAAADYLAMPVAFELSAFNVDKPPIAESEALSRMAQFAGHYAVYLTNAPTFLEKARLFGDTIFIVGYDTAQRILHPKYYDNSAEKMRLALVEFMQRKVCFLVAARLDADGIVKSVRDLPVSAEFSPLFRELPNFRNDISSTELRKKGLKGSR